MWNCIAKSDSICKSLHALWVPKGGRPNTGLLFDQHFLTLESLWEREKE